MGSSHLVSTEGVVHKGLAELNRHVLNEPKEVRNGVVREGHGLSEEDESRINEAEDMQYDHARDSAFLGQEGDSQKQQKGPIIQWERFLPVRTLKVLLVENDDSTRHVVSALLRNCGYEVTTATNGLQAWKILEDLTKHIDLVLTEVVMPSLSGLGLLSKIMSHKTCKNIPVIMMSSSDSMGTVFKCLSKGAVDFLVKPIRKNELKNLWQHVWRRCHSSSGSGSESGIQTQKCSNSKSAEESDNNSDSNDDDDNGSIGLNARDGSDNGSGTQSSWTKRAVDVDSPQPMSPSDQLADPPDSTCAQVIHPRPEIFCNKQLPLTSNKSCRRQKDFADDFMGKDLEIGMPGNLATDYELYQTEQANSKPTGAIFEKMPPESGQKSEGVIRLDGSNTSDEPRAQAADLIGVMANNTEVQQAAKYVPNGFSKTIDGKDKSTDGFFELPSLDLSLRRLRSVGDGISPNTDDRNVLRRSDLSAFTRYHMSAASNQALTGYGGSCSPLDNSSEAVKTESTYNMIPNSNAAPIKQGSNGSSNNNDMGSSTKNVVTKPSAAIYKEKISLPSAVKVGIQYTSAVHPMQFRASASPHVVQDKADEAMAGGAVGGQQREVQNQVQVRHHHHHYHHHHHHVHSMQQQQQPLDNDLSLKNIAASGTQCGTSNVFTGGLVEGHAANYSLNGSNSGSNHGSNGQNASNTAANGGEGMNIESANGAADKCGGGGGANGSGSGSGSGVYQNWLAQREAALNKFRQKRKERNFGKKVRYQSRKRLAEQRPRVRGQFVRQTALEQMGLKAER
uniref:Two-component response regulator-like PRR37 n=1 Tax=Ananas comosus var. bracteatus TaxID=296719 RepID=A0A6V7QGC4_ANACO|nr:unnamed protein product [Ananas comosus var. bracteatus]